jgi:hypothetical protein
LRNILLHNDLLFMIEEPLAKEPRWHATAQDRDEYHKTREIATEVKTLMATSMEPRLRVLFQHRDPYSMFRALKHLFAPKVRALKYDCLNEFFNTKMEENASIDSHLSNMHRIYRRLVDEFECEITDEIRKSILLQLLPSSYFAFVGSYVIGENNDNFHQCLSLRGYVFETPYRTTLLIDRSLGNRGCVEHNFFVICTEPQQLLPHPVSPG